MKTLRNSDVIFNEELHTYHLNGVALHGVTGILSRRVFPFKYDGIPQAVLDKAADYGKTVHKQIETLDVNGFVTNTPEVWNYMEIVRHNDLEHVASEYLVSDENYTASSIDVVYRGEKENEFIIADIKTTYKLDKVYLAWQLGFYKYLFELQNPDCKVTKCYGIWLRHEDSALVEIEPKTAEEVKAVIEIDKNDNGTYEVVEEDDTMPSEYFKLEKELFDAIAAKKVFEDEIEKLKKELQGHMDDACAKTWKGYKLTMTRKADTIRKDFDKKRFEKDHADLYGQYIKETTIKGGITIRIQQ